MCFPWHSSSFNSSLKIKLTEIELKNWYSCLYKCSSVGKYVSMYEQYLSEFWRPTYFAYLIRLLFTHLRTYLHEGHSWSSQNQRKSQPCNMDVRGYRFFYGSSTWFRFCKSLQGLPSLPVSLTIYIYERVEHFLDCKCCVFDKSFVVIWNRNKRIIGKSYVFAWCRKNEELVARLGLPEQGSKELHFSTRFPQNAWEQFKACLWKQELSYWRSPKYNLVRLIFIIVSSLIFGALLWQKGQKM